MLIAYDPKRMLIAAPQHLYCIWHALAGRRSLQEEVLFLSLTPTKCCSSLLLHALRTSDDDAAPGHIHTNKWPNVSPSSTPSWEQSPSNPFTLLSVKCHMRDRVSGMDIFNSRSSQMLSKVSEGPYLECELEIEIQGVLKLLLQFVDKKKGLWKDHLYNYLHFFCVLWPRQVLWTRGGGH